MHRSIQLASIVLFGGLASTASATSLDFSNFSGPSSTSSTTNPNGTSWLFSDVTAGVDMVLELTGISTVIDTPGNPGDFTEIVDFSYGPDANDLSGGDWLLINILHPNSTDDRFVDFTASFVDADDNSVAVTLDNYNITFGDLEYYYDPSDHFVESVTVSDAFCGNNSGAGSHIVMGSDSDGNLTAGHDFDSIDLSVFDDVDHQAQFGFVDSSGFSFTLEAEEPDFTIDGVQAINAQDNKFTISGSLSHLDCVPEPSSAVFLGLGGVLALMRRRR